MSETTQPFSGYNPDASPSKAQRDGVLARIADAADCLIGAFDAVSLNALFLNDAGRRWLDPTGTKLYAFTLPEIIGVRYLDRFGGEIRTQALVTGRWSGDCDLRDAWGSESPARLTLISMASTTSMPASFGVFAVRHRHDIGSHAVYDRELLHALLESVPDNIYFKDAQSRFLRVSRAMIDYMGLQEPEDLIGKTDFDCFTAEHAQPAYGDEQRIIASGQPILDHEEKETWPDGRVTWASTSKFPLRDSDGRIVGTFGISRDITSRKAAEAERREIETKLQLAQKLESIGRLAAGIAHEINTPTQYISDNVHFLARAFGAMSATLGAHRNLLEGGETGSADRAEIRKELARSETEHDTEYFLNEVPATLEQTSDGLARISRIVRSLKEFSHPNNAHRGSADLNRAIETAIAVSRHEWKYVAEVVTEFDPALPPVPCVLDEFNQVMLNLIVNAAQAIGPVLKQRGIERGRITIRTRHSDREAIVEVADSGTGIAPEHRERMFEPFFTTKEPGKGTGQGLGIVHTVVVKRHGGTIDFTTEVGVGTTFRITLPLREPALEGNA